MQFLFVIRTRIVNNGKCINRFYLFEKISCMTLTVVPIQKTQSNPGYYVLLGPWKLLLHVYPTKLWLKLDLCWIKIIAIMSNEKGKLVKTFVLRRVLIILKKNSQICPSLCTRWSKYWFACSVGNRSLQVATLVIEWSSI